MKKHLLIAAALMCGATVMAQRTPKHNFDFETYKCDSLVTINWDDLYEFFDSWQPGTPPLGLSKLDDEFFKSRQRPLPRIVDGDYQVFKEVPAGRKMLMWTPLDDPTSRWKALPRYCFEGDNFSMWQYINCHGNWTAPWLRVSAGISDAAAKNGVTVGCVMSIPWNARVTLDADNQYSKMFKKLTEKDSDNNFKNSLKLAKLMKYYGINGLGVNSEFSSTPATMNTLIEFFADVHHKAESIGWKFELQWYDLTKDNGAMMADAGLGSYNKKLFGEGDNIVTDQMFANYNWYSELLKESVKYAKSLNRDPYDYYAGFDIQGRALKNDNWRALMNNEISVGFWGAHSQSLIHQSATDDGTSDVAIQKAYLKKQEMIFSGGNRNPGLPQAIRTDCTLSNADLETFHGLALLLTAKSTIQNVPFVTRFNLGNGLKYYKNGDVAFDSKWYNLNVQDYLPTWRFWITDKDDQVTESNLPTLAQAELSWDDAYTGGSSLRLYGKTDFSRIKLFKTMLATQPSYELSMTYKTKSGTASHGRLFVALKHNVTDYREIDVPNTKKEGEWTTFTTTLDKLGLQPNDTVAMIGVALENTPEDYQMNIGELALRNPAQSFATVEPEIKEIEVMRGWYNAIDFKMRYASREETGEEKTYNDEVGTWYYEIYSQQEGEEPKLLTATESWAAYVIGAPLVPNGERKCRFGVRAVSPDGIQCSGIAWSDYQNIPYNAHNTAINIDRAVIKPGETFKVSYEDMLMPQAKVWEIIDPVTGEVVAKEDNARQMSTSIGKVGTYDLAVTNADGTQSTIRGYIKITPDETGAVPEIGGISSSKLQAKAGENIDFSYIGRNADGKVSRAFTVADPDMLSIPAATLKGTEFSIALWFKADSWEHDKEGTNLISKNTIYDSWPFNNWGDIWVQVRPEFTEEANKISHKENEISFNTLGFSDMDNPNGEMMTTGYSATPGVWNHIVVTQDAKKMQKIYFNGKCVAGPVEVKSSTRREILGQLDSRINYKEPANIYVGGGGVYKAAFNGDIDEVQIWGKALNDDEVLRAMNGYADDEVPQELFAYYTFEEIDDNGMFPNHGMMKDCKASVVRVVDAGGESTANAAYVQQKANNDKPGYPGIVGSLDVKTVAEWRLGDAGDGSIVKEEGPVATVSYMFGGEKDITLKLSNIWGEDEMTKNSIVEIDGPINSVDNIERNSSEVCVAPLDDSLYLRFAEGGSYLIDILAENGVKIQSTPVNVAAGQTVSVGLTGSQGVYIVQVMKGGTVCKNVKVIKKS